MKWIKLKEILQAPVFLTIWLTLGALFLFFSWKGRIVQEERQAVIEFTKILDERNAIAQQLQKLNSNNKREVSEFKNKLVKRLLLTYVNKVNESLISEPKVLKKHKRELAKLIKKIPQPFSSGLHVSIARNGNLFYSHGPKLSEEFGRNWHKNLIKLQYKIIQERARKHDETKLVKISKRIFSLPMERDEYSEAINQCQLIYHFQSQSYYYFYPASINFPKQRKRIDLLMSIPSSALNKMLLEEAIQKDLISRHPELSLGPSDEDYIRKSNGETIRLSSNLTNTESHKLNNIGLDVSPQYTDFIRYCKQHVLLIMLLLLPGLCLTFLGGMKALRYNFEWTLILIFLFSMSLSYLLIDQFYLEASQQKKISLLMNAHNKLNQKILDIEISLENFSTKLANKMSKIIQNPKMINDSGMPDRSLVIRLESNGRKSEYGDSGRSSTLQVGVLRTAALAIVTMQEDWNPQMNSAQFKSLWYDRKLLLSSLDLNLKKYRLDANDYTIFNFNKDSYLHFIQHNKATYGEEFEGRFMKVPIFQQGYYFYWKKVFNSITKQRELFVAGVPGPEYLKSFMRSTENFADSSEGPVRWYVKAQKQSTPIVNQIKVSNIEGARAFDQGRAKSGQLVNITINQKKYLMQYVTSDKLPGYEFLLFLDENRTLSEHRKLELSYKRFIPAYFLLGILTALFLSRQVLKPVSLLESGFDRLQEENYNYRIENKAGDESRKLLQQFNYMMDELNQRNAMRPFVSDAANHLFKIMSQGNQFVESNGAVLFSDIRSFTSISENHTAEEIVEMLNAYFALWQNVVYKHGGIIDRFEGDAISVVFLEEVHENYIHQALKTAAELCEKLPNFNAEREKHNKFGIKNGIGIAQSMVSFAIVGTEEKQEFFIYGNAPESAENLEAISKVGIYTNVMVDKSVYDATHNQFEFEAVDLDEIETQPIYELKHLKPVKGEMINA